MIGIDYLSSINNVVIGNAGCHNNDALRVAVYCQIWPFITFALNHFWMHKCKG